MWTYLTAYAHCQYEGDIVSDMVHSSDRTCRVYTPCYWLL